MKQSTASKIMFNVSMFPNLLLNMFCLKSNRTRFLSTTMKVENSHHYFAATFSFTKSEGKNQRPANESFEAHREAK